MSDVVEAVPGFWLLAGGTLAAIVAEIAILGVSRRRLARQESASRFASQGDWQAAAALAPPGRAWEIVAAVIPFALAAGFARAIHGARSLGVAGLTLLDPSEKATMISRAMSGELNAIPMGLLAVSLVAGLGCVAVGLGISARLRARGLGRAASLAPGAPDAAAAWLKHPGPNAGGLIASLAAFLVLGFGPIAHAEYATVIQKIKTFAGVAGVSPDQKGAMFDRALDDASRLLDERLVLARAGVGVAALVAAWLAFSLSSARARSRMLGGAPGDAPEPGAVGIATAGIAIAAAVVAFFAARPLRAENRLPWPPFEDGGDRLMWERGTPDLEGPDKFERAPVIHLTTDTLGLDGSPGDGPSIADRLVTLRQNYGWLHPNEPFGGEALLICEPRAPRDLLVAALRAAIDGGFPHVTFGFLRREEVDRPLLGHHWRNIGSAAKTTVIEAKADADDGATIVDVSRFPTCTDLSKAIVATRRAGHDVALLLPDVAHR